ncbi:MAG: GNAT family N-acetyltransferase [Chloroflexota bacterium]
MKTTLLHTLDAFDTLTPAWNDLLNRAATNLVFMTPEYQRIWWQWLRQGELAIFVTHDSQDKLVGVAPLFRKRRESGEVELRLIGCVGVSDYLDVLVDEACAEAVYTDFLDYLTHDESLAWDSLSLCSLPQTSPTLTLFAEMAQARGWKVDVQPHNVCPVITFPDDWGTYLTTINKKQRHEIRRKIRKLENETESHYTIVESEAELPQAMEIFFNLHRKSTPDKDDFWSDNLYQFFNTLVINFAKNNWVKLFFIHLNDVPAACMLCFDYNGEFLLYNSGYDPTYFANLSPGNVLTPYTIRTFALSRCKGFRGRKGFLIAPAANEEDWFLRETGFAE